MNINKASVTRKFNLGNYESIDLTLEADLNEKDNPLNCLQELRDAIEMEFINMQRKDKPAASPAVKSPMQLANENTVKRQQAAQADPTKCPKCGANKKPQFPVCYRCWEEEKAT